MSPRAKDPLAAMRARFNALGYDGDKMIEQMKDPAFRKAFNAPRKLHGSAPPPDEPRLLRRDELPAWCKPMPFAEAYWQAFYAAPDGKIGQAVFMFYETGAVFMDLVMHDPTTAKRRPRGGDLVALPGCVLIAVGVEQLRRARAGR